MVNLFGWRRVQSSSNMFSAPSLSHPTPMRLSRSLLHVVKPVSRFVVGGLFAASVSAGAQLQRSAPTSLSDAEFWEFFTTMSEVGGTFPSENFVSNEMTFQYVIPALQRTVTAGGVYLGVGPEQNFTYIANLKPAMAVIFDIRRQNAMAHLMYKALFEMSPTRADFVARLFSRPMRPVGSTTMTAAQLFAIADTAREIDSIYAANEHAVLRSLVEGHHFSLSSADSASIKHVYAVFFEAGPEINYSYRLGRRGTSGSTYPTYALLQTLTNADSAPMAFLATEENYRVVRDMHLRNLIVPVVGDFGGTKAIRSVADYLKQRRMTVSAFYTSNVEQYLYQNGLAHDFYENVRTLPIDSTTMFIRSVPANGGMGFFSSRVSVSSGSGGVTFPPGAPGTSSSFNVSGVTSVEVINVNGDRVMRITRDSAGKQVVTTYRDSAGAMVRVPDDTTGYARPPFALARPTALGFNSLTSGIASIRQTLDAVTAGHLWTYPEIIAMTKIDGWK